MTDVFISYSRKDTEFVQILHRALTASHYQTWVDWEDIPKGAAWFQEILSSIEGANIFIFVISPDSVASDICGKEIAHAVLHKKRMIPILRRDVDMDDSIPVAVSQHNWLFFRESDDFDSAFTELVNAINTDLDYVRMHTRLLVRAREWEVHEENADYLLKGDDLQEAEAWLSEAGSKDKIPHPTGLHTRYIYASQRASRRWHHNVQIMMSIALALTIIQFFALFLLFRIAIGQNGDIKATGTALVQDWATAEAQIATAEQIALANRAEIVFQEGNVDLALALALDAASGEHPQERVLDVLRHIADAPDGLEQNAIENPDALITWIREHSAPYEFSCAERETYQVKPLCEENL